jgi:transposase
MMAANLKRMDLDVKELDAILDRALEGTLDEQGYEKLKAAISTLGYLTDLIGDKDTTINRLRKLLFGAGMEKSRRVLESLRKAADASEPENATDAVAPEKEKPKGHGRNGARAYTGAKKIKIPHEMLKPGAVCPDCHKGKVYRGKMPAYIVRIIGQAPIGATVWELENLRCNLCLKVFTARTPEGIGEKKYDETSGSMIALLKYGGGFPFNRLQRVQLSMGIPLPSATQLGIVREVAGIVEPAYREVIWQAAQGEVLHNDDTSAKILDMMKAMRTAKMSTDPKTRTGMFTSGIVSLREGREIALFFTGGKHAGENLRDVLAQRAAELQPPIQMCDGLSRNLPKEFEVILAGCNVHARRNFVDVAEKFPDECRYVLDTFRNVYENEALAKKQAMSAEQRLAFHKAHTGPLMDAFRAWLREQIDEKKVEPNSGLGDAIHYTIKHWDPLTLFLRVAGAPLDNNDCERILKKAILHRKSSLFYKTENGAHVGDIFMSLIHTCELCKADPFDYLTQLQIHSREMTANPKAWLPWNYRDNLQQIPPTAASP